MQLASTGARAQARNISNNARNIHFHAFNPAAASSSSIGVGGAARRVLLGARQLLANAFLNLTKPGIGHVPAAARSVHLRIPNIHERMGPTYRHAMSRPFQAQHIPRAPTVPRSMTQVGLGTARNFSSGRVLFENVVNNVPIAGRAFVEADWNLHMQNEKSNMKKSLRKEKKKTVHRKIEKENIRKTTQSVKEKDAEVEEFEQFFAGPLVKPVTTSLHIPLAPTPTERMPLPADTTPHDSLLPLPTLASMHNAHELHALRVSTLFSRLDAANVWDRGVKCSAYGGRIDAEGVCTILKVEFEGWTKAEVESVIGESGKGWCELEETKLAPDEGAELSAVSSVSSDAMKQPHEAYSEPAQSLVIPTLDFSSSFTQYSFSRPPSDEDIFSDIGSDHLESFPTSPSAQSDTSNGWVMFSSDFAQKAGRSDTPERREDFLF